MDEVSVLRKSFVLLWMQTEGREDRKWRKREIEEKEGEEEEEEG